MDNEMFNRVELAIRLAIYSDNKGTKEATLLAIKAMREPTEKMIAGAIYESSNDNAWRAMIDVVIND